VVNTVNGDSFPGPVWPRSPLAVGRFPACSLTSEVNGVKLVNTV